MNRRIQLVALLILSAGLTQAARGDNPAAAFDAAYAQFSEAYRQADPDLVPALYTEDAYYLSPNREIAKGGVRSHFAWLEELEPGKGPVLSFEIVDRGIVGDLAYDIGIYTLHREDRPEGQESRGKFIVIWKRGDDGEWRIHADGFSGIRPEEEAEAASDG